MEIIHHHFESLSSTNDWAKEHLTDLPKGTLLLVTAEGQTAARGQYGREWIAPTGKNVYATFGFYTPAETDPFVLTRLLALAAIQALEEFGVVAELKWPNDLLVKGKKIAGILCETRGLEVSIGIGLNVNMTPEELGAINQPATSLLAETACTYGPSLILNCIQKHFVPALTAHLQTF